MKIKTRLRLNTFISLGAVILILLSLVWSFREITIADRNIKLAEEMRKVAFDRILLHDEYLLYQEERAKTQWHAKSEALRSLLAKADTGFVQDKDKAVLQDVHKDFAATFSGFSKVMEGGARQVHGVNTNPGFSDAELQLISQVFLKAYSLTDNINRLHESAYKAATNARNRATLIVVIFILSGIIAIIANSTVINKTLSKRITALGEGVEIIGAGNLDYCISVEGNDELSALALASNEMAAKLKQSYTSVEELNAEIERRKRTEQELLETTDYLDNLIGYANAPIIVWDPQFHITRFNHAFEILTGRKTEDVLGYSLEILFPRDQVETSMGLIRKTLGGVRWEAVEISILHLDGSTRIVLWNSATIFVPDGITPIATIAQGQDITERKRAELSLSESKERFRIAAETSNDVVYEWDLKQSVKWFGKIDEMLGFAPGEFPRTLDGWAASVHPEDLEQVMAAIQAHLKQNVPYDAEYRVRRKDGDYRWWTARGAATRSPEGTPVRWVGTVTDITERKQMIETLAIQARIATIFLTSSDDGMFNDVLKVIMDKMQSPFGVFGFINKAGALVVPTMTRQIWGECQVSEKTTVFPREKWGCSSWPTAIREKRTIFANEPSAGIPEGHVQIQRHISMPILFKGDVIGLFQVANKETNYTEADLRMLSDIAGHVAFILSARLQRRWAEEQLELTLVDLQRSNKELEQFAYVASHDLQEPLRMVASYTQLLADRYENQLDEKAKKFINYAVDGSVRMQLLINDLLTFSRIGTRGKPLEPVDSHAVLGEAINNLKMNIEETKTVITNDELPVVQADASQLAQLFQNLIGNAIKFRGEEHSCVHISARDEGREWLFSVKDNGIGIGPQYTDKVFVIFQRLHTKEEYPGSGIGLAICKKIVERHGGRIWFESEPDKGTTFYFTIPK